MPATRDLRAFAGAFVVYAALFLLFFAASLSTNNYIAPSDSLDFGLASYLSSHALWTDDIYSGYPIGADPQSVMWYLPFRTFQWLGLGWDLFMVLAYALASSTTFILVRRLTRSTVAGLFGGAVFGYSGVMLAHISHFNQIHAAAWIPLLLYGLQRLREGEPRLGAVIAALAVTLLVTAGHPQNAVYAVYVSCAASMGWLLIDRAPLPVAVRRLAWTAAALALGVALAGITVVPMLELAEYSRRAVRDWLLYIDKPLPSAQLLTMIFPLSFGGFRLSPDLHVPYVGENSPLEMTGYVGLLPLSLALSSPFLKSSLRKEALLWTVIAAIALVLALGAATPLGTLFFYAPGYASFRVPARHLFVVTLAISIGAGLVFADMTRRPDHNVKMVATVLGILVVATAALCSLVFRHSVVGDLAKLPMYQVWAFGLPVAVGIAFLTVFVVGASMRNTWLSATIISALLIALHVADMSAFHYVAPGYNLAYDVVDERRVRLHQRMQDLREELRNSGERVLAVDGSKNWFLLPNLTRAWRMPAASGTGSLGIRHYLEALRMGGPGDVSPDVLSHGSAGLDLFSIRYVLIPESWMPSLTLDPKRWTEIERLQHDADREDTKYRLYRNERAQPRAWCVSEVEYVEATEALTALHTAQLPSGRSFNVAETALVDPRAPNSISLSASPARVVSKIDGDGRRQHLVTATGSCLLVTSEVYYPWWHASVDGVDVAPWRVNRAMIGIPVPAGTSVVRMWIRPTSVWIGATVTALAGLCMVVLFCTRAQEKR